MELVSESHCTKFRIVGSSCTVVVEAQAFGSYQHHKGQQHHWLPEHQAEAQISLQACTGVIAN